VSLRCARRDAEAASDFLVRATAGDQLDHLTLPIRDDGRALMQDFDHGGDANNGSSRSLLPARRIFAPYSQRSSVSGEMAVCAACGQENPDTASFCNACAAPLQAAPTGREERKVVTVLFADLVGFTARAEQLDPEDVRALLAPYHAHLRAELERYGGTVEKFIGDAVMALFGAPSAHEDDPVRAVRAALDIRDWAREQDDLQVRIAVNTGEALVALGARASEGEGMAAGDVVNTAARLQSAAPVNGVLVGETTYRATSQTIEYREAEPVDAKGKSQPIRVWEALDARARFGTDLLQARSPLVGRDRELDLLRDAFDRARRQRGLQLVTLVGVPGIGKSRLVYELFSAVEAEPDFTTWRQGRSLPYGEGASFWALAEIVKGQAGILESDSDDEAATKLDEAVRGIAADAGEADWMAVRMRSLVGLAAADDEEVPQSESFSAWRSFLQALADDAPLVLVFEDLHWADDGLLDFVDQLAEWARSAPILVLCTARPELLERRPGWGGGKANALTLSLPPLEDEDTARLLSSLLETPVVAAETQAELLSRAAGNPLYAEQYARMLVERGSAEQLPETVQGIIAARLDLLAEADKTLLQDAAVVGKVFWLGSVCEIGGVERAAAEEALLALERKELVQRARRSSVEGEAEYAFRHLLVREVAYGQIPRAARAGKHAAAAAWVEGLGRADDHAEMLASHYLSALEYTQAAGTEDPELAARARLVLRDAGDRAVSLYAWPAAASFYGQALELWPKDDPERPMLAFRCGRARENADGSGFEVAAEGFEGLEAAGDAEAAASAAVFLSRAAWLRRDPVQRDDYLARALQLVGDDPDSAARVAAISNQAFDEMSNGNHSRASALVEEGITAAERLGLDEYWVRLVNLRGTVLLNLGDDRGFADLDRAASRAREIRSYEQLQSCINNRMTHEVAQGRLAEARTSLREMRENLEHEPVLARRLWIAVGEVELAYMAGDWDEARARIDAYLAELRPDAPHVLEAVVRSHLLTILHAEGGDPAIADQAEAILVRAELGQGDEQSAARTALLLLRCGRRERAAALLDGVFALGSGLVSALNDAPIVETAWLALDLGRQDELAPLVEGRPENPWTVAAGAICAAEFGRAADVLGGFGYRPGEAYARLRAARQLVEEGRRAEADVELQRSLAFWREMGATRYVREGEALLAASA
jgi:class 3 adenylate cyclase